MWLAAGMSVGCIPKPGDQKSAGCPKLCGSGRAMGKSGIPVEKKKMREIKQNSIITN